MQYLHIVLIHIFEHCTTENALKYRDFLPVHPGSTVRLTVNLLQSGEAQTPAGTSMFIM